jgi:maleate isomerase
MSGEIRIGLLTPHAAAGPEAEFPAIAPGLVLTCVARVLVDAPAVAGGADPTTPAALRELTASPLLDEAAELFGRGSVDAIGYASTSSGYAIGFDAEAALVTRLSRRVGVPVVATCAAAVLALRVLDVGRIALVDPPWFGAELNALGAAYFQSAGFDVLSSTSAALSRDPRRIDPAAVYEWTSRHVTDDADAVFIGGNGFGAAGAIARLEAAIDRPVVTSNQALLWSLLAQAGATFEVSGYGRLFSHKPRAPMRAGQVEPSKDELMRFTSSAT